jgi:AcrR family transcriptional regulator
MRTDLGRPRDSRIDAAVLQATVDLLGQSGYAGLSVDAIA